MTHYHVHTKHFLPPPFFPSNEATGTLSRFPEKIKPLNECKELNHQLASHGITLAVRSIAKTSHAHANGRSW